MSKPAAEIKRLEDSPAWIDQRLVEGYFHTIYRFWLWSDTVENGEEYLDLRIGQANRQLDEWLESEAVDNFIFITAWNPRSEPFPEAENARRGADLEMRLRDIAQLVRPALGIGDRGDWEPEKGFFTAGIASGKVVALGLEFAQNAIVFGEKGRPPVLWWLQPPP